MAELTEFGFERRNRTQILESIFEKFRDRFGANILLTQESVFGKLAVILAEQKLENEKLAEEVYESRKASSAEGIYLDDILNRQGVYRLPAQSGAGRATVKYGNTAPPSTEITPLNSFSSAIGVTYIPSETVNIFNCVSGFKITPDLIFPGDFTASIYNLDTLTTEVWNYTLSSATLLEKRNMLDSLVTFIETNTTDNEAFIFVDNDTTTIYVGFISTELFVGLTERVTFSMTPFIGEWYSDIEVVADTAGYNVLSAYQITGFSPSFTGFISATNGRSFGSGAEVETDAEFYGRWLSLLDATPATTRDGLVAAVLAVPGVEKVRIYANTGLVDTAEAVALSFNTLVIGGTDNDVAQAIYDSKAITDKTDGDTTINIPTLDGAEEAIKFSRPVDVAKEVRVTYSPSNGVLLNSTEITAVRAAVAFVMNQSDIGLTMFNTYLEAAVYGALSVGRLKELLIEVKDFGALDATYSDADIIPAFNETLTLDTADIEFAGSF